MIIQELKITFDEWLTSNTKLIKELINDYGKKNISDTLYDTDEFNKLVISVNSGTEDEEGFFNGWSDNKDELFSKRLKKFIKNKF